MQRCLAFAGKLNGQQVGMFAPFNFWMLDYHFFVFKNMKAFLIKTLVRNMLNQADDRPPNARNDCERVAPVAMLSTAGEWPKLSGWARQHPDDLVLLVFSGSIPVIPVIGVILLPGASGV